MPNEGILCTLCIYLKADQQGWSHGTLTPPVPPSLEHTCKDL